MLSCKNGGLSSPPPSFQKFGRRLNPTSQQKERWGEGAHYVNLMFFFFDKTSSPANFVIPKNITFKVETGFYNGQMGNFFKSLYIVDLRNFR